MQDVAGIDRQQRRRPAQQHGKQVQRNGAEHHGARAHEAHAFGHALIAGGFGGIRLEAPAAQVGDDQCRANEARDADGIDRHRPQRIQEAAQRRTRDHGGGEEGRIQPHRLGQPLRRHQEGQQRRAAGAGKAPRCAEQHQHGIEGQCLVRGENRQGQEQRAARRLQGRGEPIDPALVEAVGDVTGRQCEKEHGQELAQPHQAQRQGRTFHVVDLPADGHRLDLDGQGGNETRGDEKIKIAVAINGVSHGLCCLACGSRRQQAANMPCVGRIGS